MSVISLYLVLGYDVVMNIKNKCAVNIKRRQECAFMCQWMAEGVRTDDDIADDIYDDITDDIADDDYYSLLLIIQLDGNTHTSSSNCTRRYYVII